jgi:hypothetical protein
MRTIVLILIGLALAGLAMWLSKPARRIGTAWLFTGAWLLVTSWNLYTGMSHGYSLQEELPIQSAVFAVPVIAVWAMARRRG